MQKDTKPIASKEVSGQQKETEIIVPPDPSAPRQVMRDGQEVFVETRTGTGATIPGMKSIAGESGQSALRLHETVVPAPTGPAVSGEVLAGGRQAAVPDADFRHVNAGNEMADPLAPRNVAPAPAHSTPAHPERTAAVGDVVLVGSRQGRVTKAENGKATEIKMDDGTTATGVAYTFPGDRK